MHCGFVLDLTCWHVEYCVAAFLPALLIRFPFPHADFYTYSSVFEKLLILIHGMLSVCVEGGGGLNLKLEC